MGTGAREEKRNDIFYISYFLAVVFYMKPSLLSDSRAWKPKFYKIIVTHLVTSRTLTLVPPPVR